MFSHEVELKSGTTFGKTFAGAGDARAWAERRPRTVAYIRSRRGTVEYRQPDMPEDD